MERAIKAIRLRLCFNLVVDRRKKLILISFYNILPKKGRGGYKPENRPINPKNQAIMRHIYIFIKHKVKRRLNGRYSLKSDQIETYYQTEVYSHSYQNHVIQNFFHISRLIL